MTVVATEDDEAIGRRLRSLRERAGLSQADVADALTKLGATGFYPQTIAKLESGSRSLRFHEAAKLIQALEASWAELIADLSPAGAKRSAVQVSNREVRRYFERALDAAFQLEEASATLRQAIEDLEAEDGPKDLGPFRDTLNNCTAERAAIEARNALNDPKRQAEFRFRARQRDG